MPLPPLWKDHLKLLDFLSMECTTLNVLVLIDLTQVIIEEDIKELIALTCCQEIWEHLTFWTVFFSLQKQLRIF